MADNPEIRQFKTIGLTEMARLTRLNDRHLNASKEICIERARHITHYLRDLANEEDASIIRYAKAVRHFLRNKTPLFMDDNLLPGTTTSKYFGAPVYPELTGMMIWPELDTIGSREANPQQLTKAEADELAHDIFPFWMERNILERTRDAYNEPKCLKLFEKLVFFLTAKAGAISHVVPNYERLIENGIEGIIDEADQALNALKLTGDKEEETTARINFYRAVVIVMEGVLAYASSLARKAAELAAVETDDAQKANLTEIAAVLARVPRKPARTFREAVTSLWLGQVAVHAESINMAISPGRVDQILYKYYRRDMADKTLSAREAMDLVGCYWIKLGDNTNLAPRAAEKLFGGASTAPAVTLGGVDTDGNDAVNELTYLFLRVTEMLKLQDPNVNARYHYAKNSDSYLERVSEVIVETKAIPAFYNDVADIETLMNQGVEEAHARDFAVIGCVELSSAGRSFDMPSAIILNLIAPLEMTLYSGKRPVTGDDQIGPETDSPEQFEDFAEFWDAFKKQLTYVIDEAVTLNNHFGAIHQQAMPLPLLSAFFEGPMATGKDLTRGGAVYNSSGATHVGFADTVDSLCAIEQAIFIDKKCTFAELVDALEQNFEGHEILHTYLVNRTPKFGTDSPIAQKNASNLVQLLYKTYQSKSNYRGGVYRPAYWTMTNHAGQGALVGALPNGRKAYKVLASGITPVSQAAWDLAACLDAVGGLDGLSIPGGEAFNLKYSNIETEADLKRFAALVKSYFQKGGLQVQFNIMSYDMLIDAMDHPENYRDLIVRVSGYSAYFNDLTDAMKHEIITRTAYDIKKSCAADYPEAFRELLPFV